MNVQVCDINGDNAASVAAALHAAGSKVICYVDAYENDTRFDLTGDDQLAYNRMLASLVHADRCA